MKRKVFCLFSIVGMLSLMGSRTQKAVEVRVLSYNIRHGENRWGESNLREVLRVIQEHKPHLVALQAVDSLDDSGVINHQIRRLAAQTGMYYLYGASDSLANGSHGVGILSQWPFEKSQKLILPNSPGADPRALLCGLVNPIKGLSFRICSARLEYASVFDRALQSAYVNQLLVNSVQPVLLALDMGARPNEQPYYSYRSQWLDAAKGSFLPTWTEGVSGDRLDYLMALKNTRIRVKSYKVIQDYPDASDHYPILATFEFW